MSENSTPPVPDLDGWVAQDDVVTYIAGVVGRPQVPLTTEKNRIRQMVQYARNKSRVRFCYKDDCLMVNASDVYRLCKRKFRQLVDIDLPLEALSIDIDGVLPCLSGIVEATRVRLPQDLADAQRLYCESAISKHRLEIERNHLLERVQALEVENEALRKKIPGRPRKVP